MYLYQSCGPLNSRITWPLFSRQTSFISRITWPPYLKSEFGNLAYYLATLLKVRVRKSRVLVGHFITILILLTIRALLGHSFQDRLRLTRVLLGHL